MFREAYAFNQVFCWDLGESGGAYYTDENALVDPEYEGIHTGPQGSEYTDGVCACPTGSVLEEDKGNNGVCTTLSPVPTPVPTSESGDTAALVALIEALQSTVSDLQSTVSAMQSTDSSQAVTIAQQVVKISDQQSFTEDLTAVVEDQAVQMAELRAVVDTVKGWKHKVRQGTDHLSTHRISMGDQDEHGHMRGFNEVNRA